MADALSQQAEQEQRLQQQKQLLDYQYKLEMERLERAAQLESQRIERANQLERAEQERRQQAIRQQQQLAEEKKQQEAAEQKRHAISTGTGFFVAPGGYLVTNHHVIEDTTDYAIRDHKGHFYRATVVARDSNRDLALLKVDGTFPTLKIISSESVSKGQRVLAVGYPQVSIQGNESKVTDGIISSFTGVRNDENWFQISVPIQGGNSGGPLVTESGGVVGVVVATANVAKFYKMTGNLPQNVNYAIKSKVLLEFLGAQNLQNTTAAKGKVSVDAVDGSTVMVIAKNGPIDVAYTASPEQTARVERERATVAANELKRQREEALAEQKRLAEERRAEKQRSDEVASLSKRDQAILKAYPDWEVTKDSPIFVAWLAEQKTETSDKLKSPKAADVIVVIRQYHAELPKFANRYVAIAQRQQPPVAAPEIVKYSPALQPQRPSPPSVAPSSPTQIRETANVPNPKEKSRQTATAGQYIKDCNLCPEMVVIPVGSFDMGSNDGADDEKPSHRVSIPSFLFGRTEVTQGQWKVIMGGRWSQFSQCDDDCPVQNVSWQDAQTYAQKLSEKTGKQYRLPSESEWEYAARAGSTTKWSFGNDEQQLGTYAWFKENSEAPHPVAVKEPNDFGLYDMHGNVMEWVQDSWNTYKVAPADGSAQTQSFNSFMSASRVLRGGAWSLIPEALRSTRRRAADWNFRSGSAGFRIARTL